MDSIVSVVMSHCTRDFDREYHYEVPTQWIDAIQPGVRVMVPFGKGDRTREAYVIGFVEHTQQEGIKTIKKIVDQNPLLNEEMLGLARWMRNRYICTTSDAIQCMLPAGIGIKSFRTVKLITEADSLVQETVEIKGINEQKILHRLKENGGEYGYEELLEHTGIQGLSRYIQKLVSQNKVEVFEHFAARVKEKTMRVAYLAMSTEEIQEEIELNRIRRIQQIRVLEMLMDIEYISVQDLIRFAGVSKAILDTLRKHGYIDYKDIEVQRDPVKHRVFDKTYPLEPTVQQREVLHVLKESLYNAQFREFLLRGVTGSGKTEVYMQLIGQAIVMNKQAIVLVPEIALTPQMVERFKGRFGKDVAVLHSRMSPGERYDQWRLIKNKKIKVAVGARSAVFAPFDDLGMIIVDEEHETSYKSEITPKYHAIDIARKRCMDTHALLLLGSATPSIENYYRALRKEITLLEMMDRANQKELPQVALVDMRQQLEEGNRSIFSTSLAKELKKNMEEKQQAILFLNRRGHSSFILCRNCGYVVKCPHCSISMTYHASSERVICHYCGFTVKTPSVCPRCKSQHIRHFGTGTQKVEEDLKKQFDGCTVLRMDMDTTTGRHSHESILQDFREKNVHVLVGTQMIAKGHDFPNVTLVGVLAADSMLNTGDFRSSERTFQLITQVAGRAGRGQLSGRVVVQSYNTEDFSILAACHHDYLDFYKQEILLRERLQYPPFSNIAVLIVSGTVDRQVFDAAKEVKALSCECLDQATSNNRASSIDVLGPMRAPLPKIKNRYRWRVIIKCEDIERLRQGLTKVSDSVHRKKSMGQMHKKHHGNSIDLSMDINPYNML